MSISRKFFTAVTAMVVLSVVATSAMLNGSARAVSAQQPATSALPRTITVVGEGTVTIQPDIAQLQVGVDVTGDSASEASTEAGETMDAILAALTTLKVPRKDLQTSGFSIYVERPAAPDGTPGDRVIYHVNNMVTVTLRDLDQVGAALEAVIDAGANNVYGVNFSLDDPGEVMKQARRKAAEDARARAEELAALHGVTVGEVVSISEVVGGYAVPLGGVNIRVDAAAGGGPISPGEMQMTAQLQVVYAIGDDAPLAAAAALSDTTTTTATLSSPAAAALISETETLSETVAVSSTVAPIAGALQPTTASGLPRSLTVVGQGSVSLTPDVAQIQLGVEVSGASAKQASADAAKAMDAILAALAKQGIAKKDIQTSNYSIFVDRSGFSSKDQPAVEVTYRVNNMVTATIRKLDRVSAVLEAVIDAGANNVYGVSFSVDNPDAAMGEARQKAATDARARAEELAALHGVTLGEVISVSEVLDGGYMPVSAKASALNADLGNSAVLPGELQMSAQLQVIYAIAGPADK